VRGRLQPKPGDDPDVERGGRLRCPSHDLLTTWAHRAATTELLVNRQGGGLGGGDGGLGAERHGRWMLTDQVHEQERDESDQNG